MEMITRKRFFTNAAKYFSGAAAAIIGINMLKTEKTHANEEFSIWPLPYSKLDPEYVRKLAHDYTYVNGCGYAGFAGIMKPLRDKIGAPFTSIPLEMMTFAGGGINGWETICGALNGASAVISLVLDKNTSKKLINELIYWYLETPFPTDISNSYGENHEYDDDRNIQALPQNTCGSPLCHISLTTWCNVSGFSIKSSEQHERCARLSGDVVAKAVLLLNDQADKKFQAQFKQLESTEECLSCHGPGNDVKNVSGKMDCIQCHGDHHKN